MATRKIQVPAVGGVRKVIQPAAGSTATTIAGLEGQTLTVAQLKTLIGNTGTTVQGGSSGAAPGAASLIVGPGLTGGGALIGAVPLGLRFPTPPVMWVDSLLPDDFIAPVGGGGGGGTASPLTTKGDVYVFGTGNTRLPIGTDGQILTARSSATNGVDWESITNSSLAYVNTTVPAGNTVANTVTATAFASSYTIPAGYLPVGSVIRVVMKGVYSTAVAAPTISIALKVGSTVLLTTGTVSPLAVSATNDGWSYEALLVVQSVGVSGAIEAQGTSVFQTAASSAAVQPLENTAPITVDTTIAETITAVVTWGTASASNTITLREMAIWVEGVAPSSGGGGGSANITPDTHPSTPTAWDDEFEFGTALDTAGARRTGANAWMWVNQGSATGVVTQGSLVLSAPPSGTDNQCLAVQPLPGSGAWAFTAKFSVASAASYYIAGLVLSIASGKLLYFALSSNGGNKIEIAGFTNPTTFGGYNPVASDLSATTGAITAPKYLQLTYDGASTWELNLSVSGAVGSFVNVYSANVNTAFLGAAPTLIGIIGDSRTVATSVVVDWFRRTA